MIHAHDHSSIPWLCEDKIRRATGVFIIQHMLTKGLAVYHFLRNTHHKKNEKKVCLYRSETVYLARSKNLVSIILRFN